MLRRSLASVIVVLRRLGFFGVMFAGLVVAQMPNIALDTPRTWPLLE